MERQSNTQLLEEILEYAEKGQSEKFQFICNRQAYKEIKNRSRANKLIISSLRSGYKKLFKKYCRGIIANNANFNLLLACRELLSVIDFYQEELQVLTDMLDEYDAYLSTVSLMDLIIQDDRPTYTLWDHRRTD